jgi:hypothetical protein
MRKGERFAFIVFILLILGTFFLCAMLLKSYKSWMDTRESSKAEEAIKRDVEPELDMEYPENPSPEPGPPEEPDPNELKQPYMGEYSDPDTGDWKTGIVITGDKKDPIDRVEKVEKDPAPVEKGVNPSWRGANNERIDAPE